MAIYRWATKVAWVWAKPYKVIQVTLTSAWWSSNGQTVTATWVTATNTVIISPDTSSFSSAISSWIYCSAQSNNSLTFTCTEVPSDNITFNIIIFS